tara:strand:+ start:479 stop:847 length:369 start_codon:yes stop_codon:yes gene_type:complete
MKSKWKDKGLKKIYFALFNSTRGFIWLIKNEDSFKQEFIISLFLSLLIFFLNISVLEKIILITSLVFVLIIEILNTSIEVVIDRISLERHSLSGLAKDLGSLAVLFSLFITIAIWVAILWVK